MGLKRSHIYIFITLLFVIVGFFIYQKLSTKDKEVIKIGILTPLTGSVSKWGEMQKLATELALEEINKEGGVRGKKVVVIYEDDQAKPEVGVNAFKKLVEVDKVPIVVGSPASSVTLAIAPIANKKKVVLLSSGSTAAQVAKAGPYIFRIMPSDDMQAAMMAEWIKDLGFKKVALVYQQNDWGEGLMRAFMDNFRKMGGEVAIVEGVQEDQRDFRTILLKIKLKNVDAIYAPLYPREAGTFVKQAKEMGIDIQIFGADVYNTPEFLITAGEAAEGVLYLTYGQYDGPEYKEFVNKFKKKYGLEPDFYAGYCYDAFKIAIEAIRNIPPGNQIDGPNIRESLLKLCDYVGVTGPTCFNGKNTASGKTFVKMQIKEGKHVRYD